MTIAPDGSVILSLHQFQSTSERVVEIKTDERVLSFPNRYISRGDENPSLKLDSVLGLQIDKRGVVWMLDNGRRGETQPKLVAWNRRENKLHKVIYLPPPATVGVSFLNDLAIDPEHPFIYLSDPADGKRAALIIVNTETGLARRVLEGHYSVVPEDIPLAIDGRPVEVRRPDGSKVRPLSGVNPIAMDRKGNWLYFGPMLGRTLYRISGKYLRDPSLKAADIASRVEGYAAKPPCDGISIDTRNNIYISDLQNKAIGIIRESDRKYEIYIKHDRFQWPDGLCFGPDDRLYFYASQLNCMPQYHDGKDCTVHPFLIFKIKALASGVVGR
ncbi:MAG: L-dopachrome tautomerase-related protein [Verrucomicrobiota bacterium]